MRLVDSHCHLDERRFRNDRDAVIERARQSGVETMITIGASAYLQANYDAVAIAERYPFIFATVGMHPHVASVVDDAVLAEIGTLAANPKVVAIGETGLDYYYDNSPRPQQQEAFRRFIDLARSVKLPLSIHLREAYDDAVAILRDENALDVGGVIHCFSGDRRVARQLLDLNFDLSFSGTVTYKNSEELRAVAAEVPDDRFLIETDAPFLAPIPQRGKRNEPAFVIHTAAAIASVRATSTEAIAEQTRANASTRFRITGSRHEGADPQSSTSRPPSSATDR